ncbi:MAG: hypothetical protein LVR00_01965 [Rhabdochlamydiaceae bacterium]|jgi:hypothetical protein
MESTIELIRSIRDTLTMPISYFGEEVIPSTVSKVQTIWRVYISKIGQRISLVGSISIALVIFIATRFFQRDTTQPPSAPNPIPPIEIPQPAAQQENMPPDTRTPHFGNLEPLTARGQETVFPNVQPDLAIIPAPTPPLDRTISIDAPTPCLYNLFISPLDYIKIYFLVIFLFPLASLHQIYRTQ